MGLVLGIVQACVNTRNCGPAKKFREQRIVDGRPLIVLVPASWLHRAMLTKVFEKFGFL